MLADIRFLEKPWKQDFERGEALSILSRAKHSKIILRPAPNWQISGALTFHCYFSTNKYLIFKGTSNEGGALMNFSVWRSVGMGR